MKDRDDEAKQLIIDYQTTLNTENGKRVLADLRKKSTYDHSSISPAKPIDIHRLVYDEAQRSMIVYILKMLGKDPYEKRQLRAKD